MYIVTIAARMSQISFASDPSNAAAAPWNCTCALAGTPISRRALSISLTASPSDAPGARLNDVVVAADVDDVVPGGASAADPVPPGAFCVGASVAALPVFAAGM